MLPPYEIYEFLRKEKIDCFIDLAVAVTLDSICNSCDVLNKTGEFTLLEFPVFWGLVVSHCRNQERLGM